MACSALVYVKTDHSEFNTPSKKYLKSIVETITSFWQGTVGEVTVDAIDIN